MYKILVTGSAGFIGTNLVNQLLGQGNCEVWGVDDYTTGDYDNLDGARRNHRFHEVCCDVTTPDLESVFVEAGGFDCVFHNAASKKTVSLLDPRRDLEVNAWGTLHLLQVMKKFNTKRIIHASTGSVYGRTVEHPTTEEHPLNPISHYGVGKLAGERYVAMYAREHDIKPTILRYFHVFGPYQNAVDKYGMVCGIFCRRAIQGLDLEVHGDGNQIRSFTHVDDVVGANIFCSNNDNTIGEVYNVVSGIQVSVLELALRILELADRPIDGFYHAPRNPEDPEYFHVSNEKLQDAGYTFHVDFLEGLKSTFEWFVDKY
jgi:UDP-glucose 4-epimerase